MIFFDIDGTLLDYDYAEREGILAFFRTNSSFSFTPQQSIETWKQLSEKYFKKFLANEMSFQEQKRARMMDLFKKVEMNLTEQEADDQFEVYLSLYQKNWKVYPDVVEVLNKLKRRNFPLGVISNGDYQQQVKKLERIGVETYFDCVITSSEVGAAKPDKSIFLEACSQMKIAPKSSYYIGDRLETDALGSHLAGMTGIWLNRKNSQQSHPEIIIIRSLKELVNILP
ncbi:HAD family hydrolase [Shouchella clausii]|uniref:HAD family hydrolase n=1 Tax=Shouchella clausii TaxID=79880 RepID=UPI000BA7072E|nr:HAD family hydrolase [Shouchella clausii]PAD90221.1 HAD family hydrolase [Shouchella clausii]